MIHYLITEWNVDMIDMDWLKTRQVLFEKFCLPSVLSQSCKNFEWVLVCDTRTPPEFKKVLDSYPATKFYYDFSDYEWNAPQLNEDGRKTIMQRSVDLEYIQPALVEFIGKKKTDYIITSRCDNDDAISIDHMFKIQAYAKYFWKGKDFWLNLTRGYKWHKGKVYPKNSQANPFISFVESPENLKTTYQTCHTLAPKTPDKFIPIRKGEPTWLQVIHETNLLNKLMRRKGEKPDTHIRTRFKCNFD